MQVSRPGREKFAINEPQAMDSKSGSFVTLAIFLNTQIEKLSKLPVDLGCGGE